MDNTKIQTTISCDMNDKICSMAAYLGISKNDFIRCALIQYMLGVSKVKDPMDKLTNTKEV